jgi:hypothetical protein
MNKANIWAQVKALDYVGIVLGIGGLVLALLGISFGGQTAPWYVQ